MSKMIRIDQLPVNVWAPRSLPAAACQAITRTLNQPRFRAALARAVRNVCRRYPSLAKVRITISR